jgi:2-C-methyl-D-erythritol 4-phosphate cytidylyltransferase/2-C-methyl-D-erythritol 4-phosphate cytidylyltransferase/2-C-methyl-D-erythritol 2,4-cyclodiphosphate synthase
MGSGACGTIKKEYRQLPGSRLTVLAASVRAFAAVSEVKAIIIAVPDDPETGEAAARSALGQFFTGKAGPEIFFAPGGKTRQASVYNALRALAPLAPHYVLIHDGARPWVSQALIEQLIAGVKKHQAVIPLLPLTETPKETDAPLDGFKANGFQADGLFGTEPVFIKRQLKRAFIGTAQTPQAFAFAEILSAHEAAGAGVSCGFTDDAEVWAAYCGPVAAIPGDSQNRKITFPEDLE